MRKMFAVLRREFLERVRTKIFIISTLLGPLLMIGLLVVPILVADRGARERAIAVLDASTDDFGARLSAMLDGNDAIAAQHMPVDLGGLDAAADSLARRVGDEALDGFLIVTDAAVEDGQAEYRGTNVSSMSDMRTMQSLLRTAVFSARLQREGVDPAVVGRAQIRVDLTTAKIREGEVTGESGEASFFLAYTMWLLLYVAIILYGVQVMGSVVEEKQTRIVEVLISSLKPSQLLAGKVLGVGAVGLLQLGIWVGFGKLMIDNPGIIASIVGEGQAAGAFERMTLPEIPLATIVVFLTYFVLGYFLYAAMFAAVAAMVNTEAEARQAQTPVIMLLVVPTVLMMGIINNPDGGMAVALTMIPFTSPIAMPVRWAAAPVPLGELGLSVAALALTLMAVTWVAGRIYRVGILAYGKKPGVRELLRWVRG